MAIQNGWAFDKSRGFTGSAAADKVKVTAHERAVPGYAKGGKVSTPPAKPQKHFDRMENYRKERDAEPAPPSENQKPRPIKKAEGGSVKALAPDSKLNRPGGEGTKNVVGFKKGGKTKKASSGRSSGAAQKAAGALASIAAMAQSQAQPGAAGPMMPPGAATAGLPAMKRGGKANKKKK